MPKHLVFYDGKCGLCDHVVQFLLKADKKEDFVFAPLQGETAATFNIQTSEDTIILIENYQTDPKTYILGQAAFRILWLLGGFWTLIGWKCFLPPILYNWAYRFIARNRHRFFSQNTCILPNNHRFLK